MMPPYSCAGPRQEARHVDEGQDRDLEGVAEPHEARRLARRVDVEAAGQHRRLVRHHPDRRALEPDEAGQDVLGEVRLDLEEIALVGDLQDQLLHVVGRVRRSPAPACRGSAPPGPARRRTAAPAAARGSTSGRKSTSRRTSISATRSFSKAPSATEDFVVWVRAPPELLGGDDLVGHRLHHVRPGHEHVGRVAHHEDEVGHRRRIDRPAGAGPHDHADLRDHPARQDVALEDVGIAGERRHPLLDARAARVVQPDHRRAVLHRHVHDLADLLRVRLR